VRNTPRPMTLGSTAGRPRRGSFVSGGGPRSSETQRQFVCAGTAVLPMPIEANSPPSRARKCARASMGREILGPGLPPIDLAAAAAGTDELLAAVEHGRLGSVPSSHLGGMWLDLMAAIATPDDDPRPRRGASRATFWLPGRG
jgi:hypothetical protein